MPHQPAPSTLSAVIMIMGLSAEAGPVNLNTTWLQGWPGLGAARQERSLIISRNELESKNESGCPVARATGSGKLELDSEL